MSSEGTAAAVAAIGALGTVIVRGMFRSQREKRIARQRETERILELVLQRVDDSNKQAHQAKHAANNMAMVIRAVDEHVNTVDQRIAPMSELMREIQSLRQSTDETRKLLELVTR